MRQLYHVYMNEELLKQHGVHTDTYCAVYDLFLFAENETEAKQKAVQAVSWARTTAGTADPDADPNGKNTEQRYSVKEYKIFSGTNNHNVTYEWATEEYLIAVPFDEKNAIIVQGDG